MIESRCVRASRGGTMVQALYRRWMHLDTRWPSRAVSCARSSLWSMSPASYVGPAVASLVKTSSTSEDRTRMVSSVPSSRFHAIDVWEDTASAPSWRLVSRKIIERTPSTTLQDSCAVQDYCPRAKLQAEMPDLVKLEGRLPFVLAQQPLARGSSASLRSSAGSAGRQSWHRRQWAVGCTV